ncbi:M48 family peptidase [Deinococcus wulumuqiensis]|uniref:M48 family peptidase n=1 Tax=Deinococcus wulumuqiensis TaxID=980427 RepID=A0A345IKB6_9DEIO|nr:M48 family peptidase [Deinococcus wulumuqiensis]
MGTTRPASGRSQAPGPACWRVAGLDVQVRRSARRRTLALQVRGGVVTAYAPAGLPDATIRAFVEAKQTWLRQHLGEQRSRPAPPALGDGSPLAFLGETLILRVAPVTQGRREGDVLLVPAGDVGAHVETWTRRAVLPTYAALVEDYAARLGARERLRGVKVGTARSRWGSCTAAGDVRLHWLLSRAPLEVLHYVALHEAAHLLELNHSPRYWAHVARVMPEYRRWHQWLRDHGEELGVRGDG